MFILKALIIFLFVWIWWKGYEQGKFKNETETKMKYHGVQIAHIQIAFNVGLVTVGRLAASWNNIWDVLLASQFSLTLKNN